MRADRQSPGLFPEMRSEPSPIICKSVHHRHLCRGIWPGLPSSAHIQAFRSWAGALATLDRADQWAQPQPTDASTEEAGNSGWVHLSPCGDGGAQDTYPSAQVWLLRKQHPLRSPVTQAWALLFLQRDSSERPSLH